MCKNMKLLLVVLLVLMAISFTTSSLVLGGCFGGETIEFYQHGIQVPANSSQVTSRSFLGGGCNSFGVYPSGTTFMLSNRLTSGPEYESTLVGQLLVVATKLPLTPSKTYFTGQFKLNLTATLRGHLNIYWTSVFPSDLNFTIYLVRGGSGSFAGALGNGTGVRINSYNFGYNSVSRTVINMRYPGCYSK